MRFLVAMAMHQVVGVRFLRWAIISCVACQEFAKQERLRAKSRCTFVIGQQARQLISENCGTTWLQHNNRSSRCDFVAEHVEHMQQVTLRLGEESEIVEWPAAADM